MTALRTPTAIEYEAMLNSIEGTPNEISVQVKAIRIEIHGAVSHGHI